MGPLLIKCMPLVLANMPLRDVVKKIIITYKHAQIHYSAYI